MHQGTGAGPKIEILVLGSLSTMKHLSIVIAAFVLVAGTISSPAANVDRISAATGVPVATLQAERASTGLGWGSLEKAHVLANATGRSRIAYPSLWKKRDTRVQGVARGAFNGAHERISRHGLNGPRWWRSSVENSN